MLNCLWDPFSNKQPLFLLLHSVFLHTIYHKAATIHARSKLNREIASLLRLKEVMLALVEKWISIPVPEGLLYRISNRYKRFGTKAPPSVVPVRYKPVLKGPPRGLPGECRLGTFGTGL
jgi:hypothetical protein